MQRRRVAGLAAVAGILQAADGRTGMQILDNLAAHDHALAERLRPQPLAFDDLADADAARAGRRGAVGRPEPAADGLDRRGAGPGGAHPRPSFAGGGRAGPAANSTTRARSACATWKRPGGRSPGWRSAKWSVAGKPSTTTP